MSISVVTLNKGRGHHLVRLLEGLARGAPPSEAIIVEMGGDETPLPELGFPVRRTHLAQDGLPLAAARNAGRQAANGDILVYLDVDCIPSRSLVAGLARAVAEHDALICCEIRYLPAGAVTDDWTEAGLERVGQRHPARIFPDGGVTPAPQPGLFWSLAFAVRATTYDRIGGFDAGFTGYGAEDTDLAFRAARSGVPVLFAGGMHAFHQHHLSCDPPLQHFADIVANARRFHERHGLWPMDGWLDAFAGLGLLDADRSGGLTVLREPSASEISAARVAPERPF